ncbi:MAG TPA: hypothetical protein PLM56_12190 [Cyclobacteriaceae bacterium]|jgi:hypothetical protein|nr:hypothetical protein [Cytophagales bacterium]HMR57617.1 hypothetical protein [Cyclobacteriaceae bacterium]HRE65420.1 hypothetical protein [Cyclobacteriaceae bacterium]HRF34253.1 hypothetical protein [Cyclobacteriaceae bacterium]
MKLKFSYFLAFGVVVLTASVAQAQEGSQGPEELVPPSVEASSREDKPLIYEPEGKAPNNQQPVITPTSVTKTKPKASDTARASGLKPEDDVLSFNFLLHLIQKFKSSDVIGQ